MNVVILGRTKMGVSRRCIGGLTEDGQHVRLLPATGQWDVNAPFQIGQIWNVNYTRIPQPIAPHMEDVIVSSQSFVGNQLNLRNHVLERITPFCGGPETLFHGELEFTGAGNGYISRPTTLAFSTWFWLPDRDLTLNADGERYSYSAGRTLKYVGESTAIPTIPAGTLLRVSLARWWKPENAGDDFPDRCYLQLSGWF